MFELEQILEIVGVKGILNLFQTGNDNNAQMP